MQYLQHDYKNIVDDPNGKSSMRQDIIKRIHALKAKILNGELILEDEIM